MNKWAANPDPTGNLFILFFAKTVSHNNYLYQITKLKLKENPNLGMYVMCNLERVELQAFLMPCTQPS